MLGPTAPAGAGWAPHARPRGGPTGRALFAGLARPPMAADGWRCAAVRGKACHSAAPCGAHVARGGCLAVLLAAAAGGGWRRAAVMGARGRGGQAEGTEGGDREGPGPWERVGGGRQGDAGQGQGAGSAGEGAARPHSAAKTSAGAPPGAPARRRLWEYVARLVDTVLVNPLVGRVAGNFLALLYDVAACRALRRKPSLHCAGRGAGAINSIGLKES